MIVVIPKLLGKSFNAITIYPFIILKNKSLKYDSILLNHELIHIKQQKELYWIFFFVWYFIEYVIKLIYFKNSYDAYKNISFEREAYSNELNPDYLTNRKKFNFLKYL